MSTDQNEEETDRSSSDAAESHVGRDKVDEALEAAVSAICFADSADYYRALWEVIDALESDLADRLEKEPQEVFEEMQERTT